MSKIDIKEHAVQRCLQRLYNINLDMAGDNIKDKAEKDIIDTVKEPTIIYKGEGEETPIYVKGIVAVPVDEKSSGLKVVPTTYHSQTFEDNITGAVGN